MRKKEKRWKAKGMERITGNELFGTTESEGGERTGKRVDGVEGDEKEK